MAGELLEGCDNDEGPESGRGVDRDIHEGDLHPGSSEVVVNPHAQKAV